MADSLMTVAGLIADRLDLSAAEVTDLLNAAPFVAQLPADESSNGTTHLYAKKTGAPVVGFRAANAGRAFSKSVDTLATVSLAILDWSFMVDKAVADAWRKGGSAGFIAREAQNHIQAALFAYEQQVWYGTGAGDSSGFTGICDVLSTIGSSHGMVLSANGSGTSGTSVYAVRLTPNDMLGIYKGDGEPVEMGDTVTQNYVDGSGKNLPCYYTPACTWLALQLGSIYSVGRLADISTGVGETLNDNQLANLYSAFPSATPPTHFVMNRRSLAQLRSSRTATSQTGAPAPFPTEAHGVPIIVTDSISNSEALVS